MTFKPPRIGPISGVLTAPNVTVNYTTSSGTGYCSYPYVAPPDDSGGGVPTSTFAIEYYPTSGRTPSSIPGGIWQPIAYRDDGDSPGSGYPILPKTGLIDYWPRPKPSPFPAGWYGFLIQGSGMVNVSFAASCAFVAGGTICMRWQILRIPSVSPIPDTPPIEVIAERINCTSGGLRFVSDDLAGVPLTYSNLLVGNGDVLQTALLITPNFGGEISIPAGTGNIQHNFSVSGVLHNP